jgi:hypothetical protein
MVNDHYEVAIQDKNQGCTELIETLAVVWDDSLRNAEKIARAVVFGKSGQEKL